MRGIRQKLENECICTRVHDDICSLICSFAARRMHILSYWLNKKSQLKYKTSKLGILAKFSRIGSGFTSDLYTTQIRDAENTTARVEAKFSRCGNEFR